MTLSFRYKRVGGDIHRPIIPLQITLDDETQVTLTGILDSGSDVILIPKEVGESLGLKMGNKVTDIDGVGDRIKVVKSRIKVLLDDGRKKHRIPHPLEVNIQLSGKPLGILIGRIPFFREFIIEFNESAKRVRLTPSHRH